MPGSGACKIVDRLFTKPGSTAPQCPLTLQSLIHGSSDSTFEYCHWIPKHLESKLPLAGLKLDDNAANFFPTIKLIEQNVELHQRTPNLSLKFKSPHNSSYDSYLVKVSPHLPLGHCLRQSTGVAEDSSQVVVLLPKISRPFVELHFRVFCTHYSLKTCDGFFTIAND